jgi:glycosyltransferase involved in cell wall biosynthesis
MLRIGFIYNFDDRAWLGGRNYYSGLFNAVHSVAPNDVKLVFITGRKTKTSLPTDLPFLEVVRTSLLDRMHPWWLLRQLGRMRSSRRHDPLFGRFLERLGIDVLSHSQPLLARGSGIKALGWLPDLQFMHLPEMWPAAELARVRRVYEDICRDSTAMIVSSHASQADLKTFAPWYVRPSHVLRFVSAPADTNGMRSPQSIREEYGLPPIYFHLPNQFWRHKNHRLVIAALTLLKAGGREVTVACTGNTSDPRRPDYFAELMEECRAAGIENLFRVLGAIPYRDVQALMLHSHAVINPSRFEGWSTSVEEARTLCKPVLLSDIPVHREQAPPGAGFFALDDPAALADAMRNALDFPYAHTRTEPQPSYSERLRDFGAAYLQIVRTL